MTIADKITRAKADYDAVYEAGKKAQYDAFWDNFQSYGNRKDYKLAFSREGWNDETFKPKYNMRVTSATQMFEMSRIVNLTKALKDNGVVLDTSKSTNVSNMFYYSQHIKQIPVIDVTNCSSNVIGLFGTCRALETVEKLILKNDGSTVIDRCFVNANSLRNIIIEGVIGQNGFDVQQSTKLSKASLTSIINALSATTSGLTVTLSKTAVNKAFETSAGAGDGSTSAEWQILIAPKSNWTISLI